MGNKIITEKDFWMCTGGAVPAQLQTTQLSTKKVSGHKYITIADKATSSWIDFGCRKLMLIMAILAAVIAVVVVATGGAALGVLIAVGAAAGAAGAAYGALLGSLICGQKAAAAREWLDSKDNLIIQGQKAITGDDKMICHLFGETISFAPQIKNWWQAISLGAANYIGGIMEGMMFGAAIGFTGGAIAGGPAVLSEIGLSNLGANWLATWGGTGLALRGVTTLQSVLGAYGNTGTVTGGDVVKGVFGMELGTVHAAQNIFSGKGTAADYVGLALWFLPVPKETRGVNEESRGTDEENRSEENQPENEESPQARTSETGAPAQQGEFEAFEDPTPVNGPEFETITLADGTRVKRLTANSEYTANGYNYRTDAQGRIIEASGRIRLEEGGRNNYAQRTVGRNDGRLSTDHGGHLFGDQFGGAGGKENLVPMDAQVNNYQRGQWGRMEQRWAEQTRQGNQVDVQIEPRYGDDTGRPSHFDITETINGQTRNITIQNSTP